MDSAIYNSVDKFIIGIRGNRLFVCNPTTGAVVNQLDIGPWASGKSSIAYDAASNRIYAAPWNVPQMPLSGGVQIGTRSIYRLHSSSGVLSLDQTLDVGTLLATTVGFYPSIELGVTAMDSGNGFIFCRYQTVSNTFKISASTMSFTANNPVAGSVINASEGMIGGWHHVGYAHIGTDDWLFSPDPGGGPEVVFFDYTTQLESVFQIPNPGTVLAVGADPNNHVYVTDVAQLIYVYRPNGDRSTATLLNTINTGHTAFSGVSVRRNPTDGFMYVAGAEDNSVAVINTTGSGSLVGGAVIGGFDQPIDFVFTPTARFAVQAGAVPLKSF